MEISDGVIRLVLEASVVKHGSSISLDLQINSLDDAKAEFNYSLLVPINRRPLYLAYEPFRSGQTKQLAMYVVLIKHVCVE